MKSCSSVPDSPLKPVGSIVSRAALHAAFAHPVSFDSNVTHEKDSDRIPRFPDISESGFDHVFTRRRRCSFPLPASAVALLTYVVKQMIACDDFRVAAGCVQISDSGKNNPLRRCCSLFMPFGAVV